MERRTPLWLSHHYPNEYERCFKVGNRHICRRCAVFYPAAFAVMVSALAGLRWPGGADVWLVWLLPVPVVIEWWAEHLRLADYSRRRNTILSLICAPAVGVGLARYMTSPGDTLFWGVVATYAVICIIAVVLGNKLSHSAALPEESGRSDRHEVSSQPRPTPPSRTSPPPNPEPRY